MGAQKNTEWLKSWIILTMLTYYRNTEQLAWALRLAKTDFKNKYHNLNVHKACLNYIEAVDSFRNKDLVKKTYMAISESCISIQVRQQSILKLVQSVKPDDTEVVEFLFSRIAHEKIVIQETLVKALFKLKLNGFENELIELMQNPDVKIRLRTLEELTQTPGQFNFDIEFLTGLFEYENHDITKTRIARLLYLKHPEQTKSYFIKVLEYNDPLSTKAIFMGINFIKGTPGFAKEAALALLPVFSENMEVKKAITNYLARLK
jgi:hypothetical protein